jgi:hypothetical protein
MQVALDPLQKSESPAEPVDVGSGEDDESESDEHESRP